MEKIILTNRQSEIYESIKQFYSEGVYPSASRLKKKLGIPFNQVLNLLNSLKEKKLLVSPSSMTILSNEKIKITIEPLMKNLVNREKKNER